MRAKRYYTGMFSINTVTVHTVLITLSIYIVTEINPYYESIAIYRPRNTHQAIYVNPIGVRV